MVATCMQVVPVMPPPVLKPPAQPSVVNSRSMISHLRPILPTSLDVTLLVVLLVPAARLRFHWQYLVIISMPQKPVMPPPVLKPPAQLLVVNSRSMIFHLRPIPPTSLDVTLLVVLLVLVMYLCML